MFRRYLASRPGDSEECLKCWFVLLEGSIGHGPIQLLVRSAAILDWTWDTGFHAWIGPGSPELHILAGPIQNFRGAFLMLGREKISGDLCKREGFRGGPLLHSCLLAIPCYFL